MAEYSLFPSIVPQDETDHRTARDIFEDDYKTIRKAVQIAGEQYNHEIAVNGKSSKLEMLEWMNGNMTPQGMETLKEKAEERLNESN